MDPYDKLDLQKSFVKALHDQLLLLDIIPNQSDSNLQDFYVLKLHLVFYKETSSYLNSQRHGAVDINGCGLG